MGQSNKHPAVSAYAIKHFSQEKNYTCAPACLRMILATLLGVEAAEEDLELKLAANADSGTSNNAIQGAFSPYLSSLSLCVGSGGSIDTLRRFLETGYLVLINFLHPDDKVGHFALVQELGEDYVTLDDPLSGPDFRVELPQLQWRSADGLHRQWYMALKARG